MDFVTITDHNNIEGSLILKEKYGEWTDSIECNFDKVDLGRLKSELKIENG